MVTVLTISCIAIDFCRFESPVRGVIWVLCDKGYALKKLSLIVGVARDKLNAWA